jgi:hypothetical protein
VELPPARRGEDAATALHLRPLMIVTPQPPPISGGNGGCSLTSESVYSKHASRWGAVKR